MTTLNISLPESMRDFISEQVAKGGYSTASEYIRHLIRQELERVAKAKLETLLLEGLDSLEASLLSESALQKDWLKPEEDEAWHNL